MGKVLLQITYEMWKTEALSGSAFLQFLRDFCMEGDASPPLIWCRHAFSLRACNGVIQFEGLPVEIFMHIRDFLGQQADWHVRELTQKFFQALLYQNKYKQKSNPK